MTRRYEKIRTRALALLLALPAAAGAQVTASPPAGDMATAYARQEVDKSRTWQAYRLDAQETELRALADRTFMTGAPGADGASYRLERQIGPSGELKEGQPFGSRTATVLGDTGPAGDFHPRTLLIEYSIDLVVPGGGLRHRTWQAVVDLDSEGVRVRYYGAAARPGGVSAPDLEGDPRDQDGWAKALEGILAVWAPKGATRHFFDPW